MHQTTDGFWKYFRNLPQPIQKVAKKNFKLLKADHLHPSLHFKKVWKFWSARISVNYRAIAVDDGTDFIWVWIGSHDEYERLIRDF